MTPTPTPIPTQEGRRPVRWYETPELTFAVGFEDTFIPQTPFGERPMDEYEMTQHYHFWHSDLGLASDVGASAVRWGIPWYRVEPERGRFDWSWLDQVAARFSELGLMPIVDLMHYGTPTWLANEFANASYPEAVAAYAGAVAARYRGVFEVFTPLNEPLLNAVYCGEFGYWPPYQRGHDGLARITSALARGVVLTQQAVLAANPDATFVHVEASFRYAGDLDAFPEEAEHLQERRWLLEDLVTGRVGPGHALLPYLQEHRFGDDALAWLQTNPAQPDVMGVNFYPAHSTELFVKGESPTGGPRDPRPRVNTWTEGLTDVLTGFAQRYGRPVMLTETCFTGSREERQEWLDASVACVRQLAADGLPVVGYTWWSLIDMYEWPYRDARGDDGGLERWHLPMGLYDLVPDGAGVLQRVRTPVADRFRAHALGQVRP